MASTATEADALILSENGSTRKIFYPKIVKNPEGLEGVDGCIIFQKKGLNDCWENLNSISLSTLHAGEWTKIVFHMSEIDELTAYATSIKDWVSTHDVSAYHNYVIVGLNSFFNNQECSKIQNLIEQNPGVLRNLLELKDNGIDINSALTFLNSKPEAASILINSLGEDAVLKLDYLSRSKLLNIEELEQMVTDNREETDFQTYFEQHPGVLSVAIPTLLQIIMSKPYCGGKKVDNFGGIYADFLYACGENNLSIIEIKGPDCSLMVGEYRNGVTRTGYPIVDAVLQAMNERDTFEKNSSQLGMKPIHCSCYVIAGNSVALESESAKSSFELFRSSLKDVYILTYDELIKRMKLIRSTMLGLETEGKTNQNN